jgi:murein DD-endopeptidase MepM/ murein hydrolase activator NlpD
LKTSTFHHCRRRRKESLSKFRITPFSVGVTSFVSLLLAILALFPVRVTRAGNPPPKPDTLAVKVFTKRDGLLTHFYVDNQELSEVTMTFDLNLVNLTGTTNFARTATFPGGQVTEAFTLTPIDCAEKWEFSYTNYFKLGSSVAKHDDSYSYQLPYAPGVTHKVTQAFGGSFSHKGSNLHAIDWQMREGTPVCAARAGLVVRVKDDSDTGGGSMKFDPYNNYVMIRHDDGTLGHYCHLLKGGVCVEPGQTVNAGQVIAHSGNTGFSSGPHLHFCVFKTKDGKERVSIPIKFKTADKQPVTLVQGSRYKAAPVQTVTVSEKPVAAQTTKEAKGTPAGAGLN